MAVTLLISSPMAGHGGGFQFLAIRNKAAVTIDVAFFCADMFLFLGGKS